MKTPQPVGGAGGGNRYFFSDFTSRAFGLASAQSAHFWNPFFRASSDSNYCVE